MDWRVSEYSSPFASRVWGPVGSRSRVRQTNSSRHLCVGTHLRTSSANPKAYHVVSYTSFLESHGQPLLDLSLYVSSQNYHASTRPAYARILEWPHTWLLPPKRRAAARARTDHLNLSSLDLDTTSENDVARPQFTAGTEIPRVLRSTQQTVSSLVKQPQNAARFRLDTLADSFLGALAQLQQGKYYLLSEDRMTSLDCIALGYLSVALLSEVPHSWLSHSMKTRYPSLCHYVEDLSRDCFGLVLQPKVGKSQDDDMVKELPWRTSNVEDRSVLTRVRSTFEGLPYFGALYQPRPTQITATKSHEELMRFPVIPTVFVGISASLTALASYFLFTGEMPYFLDSLWASVMPHRRRRRQHRLSDLGDAGAMLGAVNFRESRY